MTLSYADKADDTKDKLALKIKKSDEIVYSTLGDPVASTSLCVCLYANGTLTQMADIPAAGTCGDKPCWTEKEPNFGYRYKDALRSADGIGSLKLPYDPDNFSMAVSLTGKGVGLADLSLPLAEPIVVQVRNSGSMCLGGSFSGTTVTQDPANGKLRLKQKYEVLPDCGDGVQNGYETGVDCGGGCFLSCVGTPTCSDGEMNGGETGIDCGGPCAACPVTPTCSDGEMNGGETGIDCGGPCAACPVAPTCSDGQSNGDETGVDCGGSCPLCPTGSPRKMFVSGLSFASWMMADQSILDLRCNELAHGANPMDTSTYFAWSCTSETDDPESRFTKYSDPYVRFSDGVTIASGGWTQLTSGLGLDNAVLKDESGAIPLNSFVWTGTRTDGRCGVALSPAPSNCNYWSDDMGPSQGAIGLSSASTFDLWNAWSTQSCDGYNPIYCVEQ